MDSHFPIQDQARAAEFALGYFERLQADPDIRKTWLGLRALIQVHITQPDIAVSVDTRDGQTMVSPRRANSSPIPSTIGSSGPTTVRSALIVCAKSATSTMFDVSIGTQSASSAMPALPGAQ